MNERRRIEKDSSFPPTHHRAQAPTRTHAPLANSLALLNEAGDGRARSWGEGVQDGGKPSPPPPSPHQTNQEEVVCSGRIQKNNVQEGRKERSKYSEDKANGAWGAVVDAMFFCQQKRCASTSPVLVGRHDEMGLRQPVHLI